MAARTCHRIRVSLSPLSSSQCSFRRPEYIPDPKYIVRVFKTTLRDGEQSPGATMTAKEKPDIARQLAGLGVDIIKVISNLCRDGGAPTTPNS